MKASIGQVTWVWTRALALPFFASSLVVGFVVVVLRHGGWSYLVTGWLAFWPWFLVVCHARADERTSLKRGILPDASGGEAGHPQ